MNIEKFLGYLELLRDYNPKDKIAIFMDNLSVHTSNDIKKKLKELDIPCVFNVPYSP